MANLAYETIDEIEHEIDMLKYHNQTLSVDQAIDLLTKLLKATEKALTSYEDKLALLEDDLAYYLEDKKSLPN